jgi:hypothetical protein
MRKAVDRMLTPDVLQLEQALKLNPEDGEIETDEVVTLRVCASTLIS